MPRKFLEDSILIATNNKDKIEEILCYFDTIKNLKIKFFTPSDFQISSPKETEDTFVGNAELKARYYGNLTLMPALADDTGVCVDALGGMPGVYTANWAGDDGDFRKAIERVENELKEIGIKGKPSCKAVCAMSLYWPGDGHIETFKGEMKGSLDFQFKDNHGVGFQPVFIPDNYNKPFSNFTWVQKQKIGHRGKAFKKLISACFS